MNTAPLKRLVFVILLALASLGVSLVALLDAVLESNLDTFSVVIFPDSALALGLFGLALLCRLWGRPTLSCGLAGVLLLLSSYALLHNLMAGGHTQSASWLTGHQRISTLMASMFVLLAVSLLGTGARRPWQFLSWGLGMAVALCGVVVLGLVWLSEGLPGATIDTTFVHHQASTAASFFLIWAGIAVLLLGRPCHVVSHLAASRAVLLAGIVGSLLTSGGWYLLSQQNLDRLRHDGQLAQQQFRIMTGGLLAEHVQLMRRQADRWQSLGSLPDHQLWRVEVDSYLRDHPWITLIALVDEHLAPIQARVQEGASLAALEALPDPMMGELELIAPLRHDEGRGRLMVALPLAMPAGATNTWLVSLLDLPTMLRAHWNASDRMTFTIHDGERQLFTTAQYEPTSLLPLASGSMQHPPGVDWQLAVAVDIAYLKRLTLLPSLLLLFGLGLTYLLMISVSLSFLAERRQQRADANQEALRRALSERDQFFTLSLELFCRVDLEGRFIHVNPAFETLLGFGPDQLIGQHFSRLVVAHDRPNIEAAIAQLMTGEPVRNLQAQVRDSQANLRCVEINATLGEENVIYAVARDITARKASERALLLSHRLFSIVGETARIGGWYTEIQQGEPGDPIWSDEICRIHDELPGFKPSLAEAIGYYANHCRDRLVACFERCLKHGVPFDEEFVIVTRKGRQKHVRVIGCPVRNEQGDIVQVQGSTQDITEHNRLKREITELDQRLKTTLDAITDGFCTLDNAWRLTYLNRQAETFLQQKREELLGSVIWHIFPDLVGSEFEREYRLAVKKQQARHFESYFEPLQGWFEVHAYPSTEGLAIYFRDITERRQQESQLRILERSLEASINGIVIADARQPDFPLIYVNPAFERITGYSKQEILGKNCRILQGESTDLATRRALRAGIAARRNAHVVIRNYRKDGTPFWNDLYVSPVRDSAGNVTHFIGVQNDITTEKEYQSQLVYNASHDALTGLPNRYLIEDRLKQACRSGKHAQRVLALLFIDLDGFKPINDSLGHEVGDRILQEVGRRIERLLGSGDTVGRFGSDEFIVIMPDLDHLAQAQSMTERLLSGIAEPFEIATHEIRLTASIGVSVSDADTSSPMQLLQQADLAMYKAKRQGKNTFQWFTKDLNDKVSEHVDLRNALQRAIEEGQFELHYQPQFNGQSGEVVALEALLRWHHPEQGHVPPDRFIKLAEETGQIIPISEWVLRTACQDHQRLREQGLPSLLMSVNVSALHFQRSTFYDQTMKILKELEMPGELLELELTEGALMDSDHASLELLHALRSENIKIAIDDFGTGYSSLGYLKHLPVDKIKVDRSFISEVVSDHRDAAIVQGIISLATQLQLQVVAEGVETQAQFAFLRKHNCELYQGFYFARPMPYDELARYLQQHDQAQALNQAREAGEEGRQSVLLLDDEANVLRALKRLLRREGYHILTATNAKEAFDQLATEDVQVIISDQRMPEMSGTEFLSRTKNLYPDAVQIMLSGFTDLKSVTSAINEGAIFKFLTKPWDDDELRLVVKQAFRQAALQKVKRREQV